MNKALTLLALTALTSSLGATTISIDSFSITTTEVTLTISGTITAAEGASLAPVTSLESLFIGVAGDTDWITSTPAIPSFSNFSGTIDGQTILFTDSTSGEPGVAGDYLSFSSISNYDFTDGGSVNVTATIPGVFVPANIDPSQLIVTWGVIDQSNPFPNPATLIGTSAVPEASTTALVLGVAAVGFVTLRRKR